MYVPHASSPVSRHCPCVPLDIDPPERDKRDVEVNHYSYLVGLRFLGIRDRICTFGHCCFIAFYLCSGTIQTTSSMWILRDRHG